MKNETKTENANGICSHYFGYLSQAPGQKETPDECLICMKLIECKLSKSDSSPPKIGNKTVFDATVKEKAAEKIEPQTKTETLHTQLSEHQLVVENQGESSISESGAVCISKDTLSSWGRMIKQLDINTDLGIKRRFKLISSENLGNGRVMIPDELQLDLKVKQGESVVVEPVILLELEDKTRDIIQNFVNIRKSGENGLTMKKAAIFGAVGIVIGVLLIAGFMSSGLFPGAQSQGILMVKLTDAPVELSHLNITITGLDVQKAIESDEDDGWIPLSFVDDKTSVYIDIQTLRNVTQDLSMTGLAAGNYTKIRMDISTANATYVDGSTVDLTVPPGHIDVIVHFEIISGETTTILIDMTSHISESNNLTPVLKATVV